jgi:transcriptional regulator with XRE-family HTH domain
MVDINEKILQRREQLGLSDVEVAEKADIGIYAYGDIESYETEATTLVPLPDLKRLCKVLDLELMELLDIPEQPLDALICSKPRNVLVREMREKKGLSQDELANQTGFYSWAITAIESDPNNLDSDSWCAEDIVILARLLDIPVQLLLGVTPKSKQA